MPRGDGAPRRCEADLKRTDVVLNKVKLLRNSTEAAR